MSFFVLLLSALTIAGFGTGGVGVGATVGVAVGAIVPKPVVQDGQVTVRRRVRLTMSCDHRVIDGATGATFLKTLKQMLENPLAMLL